MAFLNFKASETQRILCYHCSHSQEVGRKAQTVTCQKCHKPLQVADLKVKAYDARRKIQTSGSLVVDKKGQIVADEVECGGAVVRGQIRTKHGMTVRGSMLVGPQAVINGDVAAQALAVGPGSTLEGFYIVGKDHMIPPAPLVPEAEEEPAP